MKTPTGEQTVQKALRKGRMVFMAALAFSFLCNLLRLTGPLFILLVYDSVLSSGSEETLVALFMLVATLLVTMGMVDYARRRLLARFGAQFQEQLEDAIFRHTPRSEFLKTNQVKPVAGLSDLDSIRGFFHSNAVIALLDVFWAPLFLAVVFIFHWVLGLLVIGGLLLLAVLNFVKTHFASERSDQAATNSQKIKTLKDMILTSRNVLKSQSLVADFNTRWLSARRDSRDSSITLSDWSSWFSISSRQLKMLLQYTILAAGALLTLNGQITVGVMITSMFLSVRVFAPVEQFLREWPVIRRAIENWKFLKQNFTGREAQQEFDELWNLEPELQVVSLSKKSPFTGKQILRGINLKLDPGTVTEIIGGRATQTHQNGAPVGLVHSGGAS